MPRRCTGRVAPGSPPSFAQRAGVAVVLGAEVDAAVRAEVAVDRVRDAAGAVAVLELDVVAGDQQALAGLRGQAVGAVVVGDLHLACPMTTSADAVVGGEVARDRAGGDPDALAELRRPEALGVEVLERDEVVDLGLEDADAAVVRGHRRGDHLHVGEDPGRVVGEHVEGAVDACGCRPRTRRCTALRTLFSAMIPPIAMPFAP